MTTGARVTLGIAPVLIAVGFLALSPSVRPVSPQAAPGMVILGLFAALTASGGDSR